MKFTKSFTRTIKVNCPHCGRGRKLKVHDLVPRQVFDVRCCSENGTIAVRPLRCEANLAVHEVVWGQEQWRDF